MQRFAVIGMGRFGSRLAANLAAAGQEVIAIDKDPQVIEEMRDRVTLAIALDTTDEKALLSQGLDQVDVAVVGIGGDFEAAVLATVMLKHLKVPRVISRAISATGGRVLKRIGADEVVNPEDESADRWAARLVSPKFLSHYELDAGYSLVEVKVPEPWVGKTLSDLAPRPKLGLHVVALKRTPPEPDAKPRLSLPTPDQPLAADDLLVIMGSDQNLARLPGGLS